MKIVIAMDSFKGSLDSIDCGNAVKKGILNAIPDADISVFPLSDGGEGMAKTLTDAFGAKWIPVTVSGPLLSPVTAGYGYISWNNTAIIEMASAAGLALLSPEEYDPLHTTTYGVGELILHALDYGCRNFIIGIGGSATNDGGIGMLSALGYQFYDSNKQITSHNASTLSSIEQISDQFVRPELIDCCFKIACDVTNPLCGKNGATYIYGPQKGLSQNNLSAIDEAMHHFASIAGRHSGKNLSNYPGSGAAGGIGYAFLNFLNASLVPGAELIIQSLNLEQAIEEADWVITGEGRLDSQTVHGKAPITIAKLAKKYHKKVLAFSGCLGSNARLCNCEGIDAFFPVLTDICTYEEALSSDKTSENLRLTAEQVFRLIHLFQEEDID